MARRSSLLYPVTHLPLLHNALLNAIFNHPNPSKSRLSKVMKLLSEHPSQFIILVPDASTLTSMVEQCHDEGFVQSHIVYEVNKSTYCSLNDRNYTISKNYISLPGTELKVKMLSNELFYNYNGYMSDSVLYRIIHIEEPLVVPSVSKSSIDVEVNESLDIDFNQLIREFPLISEKIGVIYREFFLRLNLKPIQSIDSLIESYNSIIASGSSIFVDNLEKDSISNILEKYPSLNINKSLFNYLEMNVYDKFWAQLCHLNYENDLLLNESYTNLCNISLNQVGLPEFEKMSMDDIVSIEKSLKKAKEELDSLNFVTNSDAQCKILVNVFRILANDSQIGADSLVGLLIITICRAKVLNLNSHLKYIEKFSYESQNFENGHVAYVLSTFTAVLEYLNDYKNLDVVQKHSEENKRLWELFSSSDHINTIAEIQDLMKTLDKEPNLEHSVYSRNEDGQSLLSMSIRGKNFNVFNTILQYEKIYPIEFILEDRNIENLTLLGQAILIDSDEMINELLSIVISSATPEEMVIYFNQCDDNSRNVGHLLFDIDLLKEIGKFIDWRQRDINSQTPFFTILRCYDHHSYDELVTTVIDIVHSWYQQNNLKFNYQDHNDSRNNTLLHVIKNNAKNLLQAFENLNLNELNSQNLTPLMYYIKYNRIRNVHDILKDERLDLTKLDTKYYLSALDYAKIDIKSLMHDLEASKNGSSKTRDTNKIVKDDRGNKAIVLMVDQAFIRQNFEIIGNKTFGITRIKSDNVNNDLCLFFKTLTIDDDGNESWVTNIHNLRSFTKFLQILKVDNPHLLLSVDFIKTVPVPLSQTLRINNFYKFQTQKLEVMLNLTCKLVLNDFSGSQILRSFLVKLGNIQEMKLLESIEHSNGAVKNSEKLPQDEFMKDEITTMKHFLDYSLEQLQDFEKNLQSLIRMMIFMNIKQEDYHYTSTKLFDDYTMDNGFEELSGIFHKIKTESLRHNYDFELVSGHKMILSICQELISTIKLIIATKMINWDESQKVLSRIETEISRLNSIDGNSDANPQKLKVRRRSSNLILTADNETRASSSSSSDQTTSTTSSSFLFSSIVQTKKSRGLKIEKLMEKKELCFKKLEILGSELRKDHEQIALKLNNFLGFKRSFLKSLFKQYIRNMLRDMKFKLKLLEKQ